MRCNVTGRTDGQLYDFYLNADFGETANHLVNERFEFTLCQDEFDKFIMQGKEYKEEVRDSDYTYQYGLEFNSGQVYDLISTFKHVPKGYFSIGWLQFTEEEEQWLWENQDKETKDILYSDVVSVNRAIELSEVLLHD